VALKLTHRVRNLPTGAGVEEVMDLTCPKCQGTMRAYERSGVTVDQCTECRGIFLDRGELERLVDADAAYHAPAAAPSYGSPQDDRGRYDDRKRYDDDRKRYEDDRRYDDRKRYDDDRKYHGDYHHTKKKRSLFEDLFD
jgi:Zn-finger nucleic acid-binding protein